MSKSIAKKTKNTTSVGFRPRGGMTGIIVTSQQLQEFAEFMEMKFSDAYIPIPGLNREDQKERIAACTHSEIEWQYYETETGSHGWCCSYCGTVMLGAALIAGR